MTEQELREKICDIIAPYVSAYGDDERIADALIAAGLRFGENLTATFDRMALEREPELERRLAEATKAMYVYERALYYATLNGETADEVKYNDALKRAQKDFTENKGD